MNNHFQKSAFIFKKTNPLKIYQDHEIEYVWHLQNFTMQFNVILINNHSQKSANLFTQKTKPSDEFSYFFVLDYILYD